MKRRPVSYDGTELLVDQVEAARRLGVGVDLFKRAVRSGEIALVPYFGRRLVSVKALEEFAARLARYEVASVLPETGQVVARRSRHG